ncbi:hypothetical protein GTP55_27455 [Duganella sp. FT109W]|uniref:Uncharacterized protein n=1 Tax=Duganella margarita TaxID=2692170 RepID=A0A7X4H6T7_9BURK|nr:hypothetical protein [Duganella margarita]MYM75886.1 hypothetical protein [Duganella margarita]MYN43086.1 hypothetical protein [Duganella margarita]
MRTPLLLLLIAGAAMADPVDIDKLKKDLGKIDRELRDAPAVPDFGNDKPFGRVITEISDAYIGTGEDSRGVYESPDGTTYYTETIRGKTSCSMTGAVGNPAGKSGGASKIDCPSSMANFKKY